MTVQLGFEFLVLTACRSGEVRGARWEEVDLEGGVWTIPAERMKSRREHRVPLSARAREILAEAKAHAPRSEWVFPSARRLVLPSFEFAGLLKALGIAAVPHGFRSSFRDWTAERTDAPHAVMEAALAHAVRNRVEARLRPLGPVRAPPRPDGAVGGLPGWRASTGAGRFPAAEGRSVEARSEADPRLAPDPLRVKSKSQHTLCTHKGAGEGLRPFDPLAGCGLWRVAVGGSPWYDTAARPACGGCGA